MMYKTQIACLIVLAFIAVFHFSSYNSKNKSTRWFSIMMLCSIVHLIFDIASIYTVNHLTTVPSIVNRLIHFLFMGLMLCLFYLAYKYLETLVEESIGHPIKRYNMSFIPLIFTLAGLAFLPLSYVETPKGNYSYGPAAFTTYVGVAIYVTFIVRLILRHGKDIPLKKRKAIRMALIIEIPIALYQIVIPVALITCLGVVMLNLGIYLTTENPDAQLAEQLEQEKQRADAANTAKTSFLANMSHEIRTPITAVLGMNEMILRESKEKHVKSYAKDVEGAAKSLLSIINDILDITKIEAGKLTIISVEYDFSSVINDVINMITFKAKIKNLEFKVVIDETIPSMLIGDDIRLRQILVNLLNNAVKYTEKGTVTLTISQRPSETENAIRLLFSIKDTGIGIKEEDLKKLCTPFQRLDEKRNRNIEGTGLGMSITKQLLALLKGELSVSSVYGEGSEFSFELEQEIADATPIGKLGERIEHAGEEQEHHHGFEAPQAKILVVDDNELNRRVFMSLLKATRVQIDEAASGKRCLDLVQQNAYDIIFLDHMMPELDGIETFQMMKQMEEYPCKNTPVVILTANAIVGAREKYLQEGFTAFLAKPIDYKKLEDVIRNLLKPELICEATFTQSEAATIEADVTELPFVEGLDWKYAKQHFPDTSSVLEAVKFFVSAIEIDASELDSLCAELVATQDGKAYCTKVHSMKNSAATIGIVPLAGMAKVLEDLARANQLENIQSMTPVFLEYWRGYKEKLSMFSGKADSENKKAAAACQEELKQLVQSIKEAAENMDIDALDELWNQLDSYQFEEQHSELLANIQKAIINFDVDYLQEDTSFAFFMS